MSVFRHLFRFVLPVALGLTSTRAVADRQVSHRLQKDSLAVAEVPLWTGTPAGRLAQSAHPVKMAVKGRSLRVTSNHEQILPIYTQGGALYLVMQLTPGVNWLNGLPRGRYRINNRTVSIR